MKTQKFLFSALLSCILLLVCLGLHKHHEVQLFSGYEKVVAIVKNGSLRANSSGDIVLPPQLAWLTQNGHVYQSYDKQSGLVLLFPTGVDQIAVDWGSGKTQKTAEIAGYVYCSGPLPSDGWFTFPGMNDVKIADDRNSGRSHWHYVEPFYS